MFFLKKSLDNSVIHKKCQTVPLEYGADTRLADLARVKQLELLGVLVEVVAQGIQLRQH